MTSLVALSMAEAIIHGSQNSIIGIVFAHVYVTVWAIGLEFRYMPAEVACRCKANLDIVIVLALRRTVLGRLRVIRVVGLFRPCPLYPKTDLRPAL
jgi:hypothetical protein